jgi:glycosyltransferase involved in cell wall biosynthesis
MVMRVPAIGTAIGGTPEQIEDGRTGILVPPDDPERLSDAIATMVLNPQKRISFRENAFAKATTLYDVEIHVKNIVNIYDSCLVNHQ